MISWYLILYLGSLHFPLQFPLKNAQIFFFLFRLKVKLCSYLFFYLCRFTFYHLYFEGLFICYLYQNLKFYLISIVLLFIFLILCWRYWGYLKFIQLFACWLVIFNRSKIIKDRQLQILFFIDFYFQEKHLEDYLIHLI